MAEKKIKKIDVLTRVEAFSDGIFSFCITLLVINLNVPAIINATNEMLWQGLVDQLPKFLSFIVSFVVIAILWVNHHHFFYNFKHTDWKLLWHNNLLLFWVILIPFTTSFLGDHSLQPVAIAVYSLVMCFASLSFGWMIHYVFFKSELLEVKVSETERKKEFRRVWPAVILYALNAFVAFAYAPIALVILGLVPIWYFVPSFIDQSDI